MSESSAGLLLVRRRTRSLEYLLGHPGGPFFSRKDEGVWTIPKGGVLPGEALVQAALREFCEELGCTPPEGELHALGRVRQRSGKVVHAWAVLGDWDPRTLNSAMVEIEWPRRSGVVRPYPELDRAAFFDEAAARVKMIPAQRAFLERAAALLGGSKPPADP